MAVNMTTASDLTAIYNCSAFFAYAFSIPLLKDKFRLDKALSVAVAIVGVLIVAYGGQAGGNSGEDGNKGEEAQDRLLGNILIGIGSVLYGLYEVLYKRLACPPEEASPGRSMIFANTFGSMIGAFTLLVLWIPLPILHALKLEIFEWPSPQAARYLCISVFANASKSCKLIVSFPLFPLLIRNSIAFSGSFLVLISLTSPVLSSVAALLTIFLVAIADWIRTGEPLSLSSIIGGILIIIAFFLLSWSTYREMNEEERKYLEGNDFDSESDDE